MKPIHILIIDDDETMSDLLQSTLSEEGWRVRLAKNGAEGLIEVEKDSPELVILDMMMPGIDGFEVCHQLRKWSQVPVIALSALGETVDKVKCLNLGADDYITKPFKIDELIARIKAVLRRNTIDMSIPLESPFICDSIKIDFAKRRVFVANNEVTLTPTEYRLLIELVTKVDKVLIYTYLLGKIWGQEFIEEREYLYVQICHLREKLESDPKNPQHIVSVPRIGYRFQK